MKPYKNYSAEEKSSYSDYDNLIKSAYEDDHNATTAGALADYMEEQGIPGYLLLREHMRAQKNNSIGIPVGGIDLLKRIDNPDDLPLHSFELIKVTHPSDAYPHYPVYIRTHLQAEKRPRFEDSNNSRKFAYYFRTPIFSKEHLSNLITDLPEKTKTDIFNTLNPHLPDTHVEPVDYARTTSTIYARLVERKHIGNELLERLGAGMRKTNHFSLPWLGGAVLDIHKWEHPQTKVAAFHVVHTDPNGIESNTVMTEPELKEYLGLHHSPKVAGTEDYVPADIFNYKPTGTVPQTPKVEDYIPAGIFDYENTKTNKPVPNVDDYIPHQENPYRPGMEPPKKYASEQTVSDYDSLLKAARDTKGKDGKLDSTVLGAFADYLEENGKPGASLAREGMRTRQSGNALLDVLHRETIDTLHRNYVNKPFIDINGKQDHNLPENLLVEPILRSRPTENPISPAYLVVRHLTSKPTFRSEDEHYPLIYRVPVFSKEHLTRLTSDLPEPMRNEIHNRLEEHLPDTHTEPENYARSVAAIYARPPEPEIHPDYQPHGIAPRLGQTLRKISEEGHTTPASIAEGILRSGDHHVLPYLANALDDVGHPLAQEFNLRHAPRAIAIDKVLQDYLNTHETSNMQGEREKYPASWVINDWVGGRRNGRLSKLQAKFLARKSVPDARMEDVWHSLLRLRLNADVRHHHQSGFPADRSLLHIDYPAYRAAMANNTLRERGYQPTEVHKYPDTRIAKFERVKYSAELEEKGFHDAIAANPEDNTTHLVYADWLQEHGQEELGQHIRKAIEQGDFRYAPEPFPTPPDHEKQVHLINNKVQVYVYNKHTNADSEYNVTFPSKKEAVEHIKQLLLSGIAPFGVLARELKNSLPEQHARKKSQSWISHKIGILRKEGYEQKQAVAIALSMAGRSKKKKYTAEAEVVNNPIYARKKNQSAKLKSLFKKPKKKKDAPDLVVSYSVWDAAFTPVRYALESTPEMLSIGDKAPQNFVSDPDLQFRIWNHPNGKGRGYNASGIKDQLHPFTALATTSPLIDLSAYPEEATKAETEGTNEFTLNREMLQKAAKRAMGKPDIEPFVGAKLRLVRDKWGRKGISHVFPPTLEPQQHKRVKYALEYHGEDEFHRKLAENPDEDTSHLVYADWLREQGKELTANHIQQTITNGHPIYHLDKANQIHTDTPLPHLWVMSNLPNKQVSIGLRKQDESNPHKFFSWVTRYPLNHETLNLIHQFGKGGFPLENETFTTHEMEEIQNYLKENPEQHKRVKYSAEDHTIHDFIDKMEKDPYEKINTLVMADWLEDQGKGSIANVVRKHATRDGEQVFKDSNSEIHEMEPGEWALWFSKHENTVYALHRRNDQPQNEYWWVGNNYTPEELKQLQEQAIAERVKISPRSKKYQRYRYSASEVKAQEERAKKVDLVVLPEGIEGTNCGNCKFVDEDKDYCTHPEVDQPVDDRHCCALWDADEVERPWKHAAIYSKVAKYSAEDEEKGFHAALEQNPEDRTTALVYADWLEEHDKPKVAEMIRGAINSGPTVSNHYVGRTGVYDSKSWYGHTNGFHVYIVVEPTEKYPNPAIALAIRSKVTPDRLLWWVNPIQPTEEHLSALLPEVGQMDKHIQERYLSKGVNPSKYAATKAPAGGMVVPDPLNANIGTFFKGGSFLPLKFEAKSKNRDWLKRLTKKAKVRKSLNTFGC